MSCFYVCCRFVTVWFRGAEAMSLSASMSAARTSRSAWSTIRGQTLAYHSMPTEQDKGAEDACGRMARGLSRSWSRRRASSASDVARAGIATPGPMDIPNGMILRPGNLPGWWDFPIRDRASHHLGMPVTFANDANAAAYGEFWRGAGTNFHSMVLLTLGTGIGGGIIIGDTLIEGAHSCGSECGHILVNPADDAPLDSLGKRGSLEATQCVGRDRADRRGAERCGRSQLAGQVRAAGETITPRIVAEEAEQGDELARRVIMETAHWLAIGIVSFIHTIDPDAVVLGGAMTFGGQGSPLGASSCSGFATKCGRGCLEPLRDTVRIEFASLGGDAGYIGAAGLARLEQRQAAMIGVRMPWNSTTSCVCAFTSRKRKVINFLRVERPQRESQLADCHGAGTGCGWCRPFLEEAVRSGPERTQPRPICRPPTNTPTAARATSAPAKARRRRARRRLSRSEHVVNQLPRSPSAATPSR